MQKQKGITFIGLVLVIAAVVFLATIGMKVVPAYIEFAAVKKVVKRVADDPAFNEMSKNDIVKAFDKAASADYITVVRGADLLVERTDAGNIVSAKYQVTLPIVANASVLLDFNATSAKK